MIGPFAAQQGAGVRRVRNVPGEVTHRGVAAGQADDMGNADDLRPRLHVP